MIPSTAFPEHAIIIRFGWDPSSSGGIERKDEGVFYALPVGHPNSSKTDW